MRSPLIIFFVTLSLLGRAQVNLVPNPSFENISSCPYFAGYLGPIDNWKTFGKSPDCFHVCSSTMAIPQGPWDGCFQYPKTGEAMLGLITRDYNSSEYREYIGANLMISLEIGKTYYFSMYVNNGGFLAGGRMSGSNKLGARFTTIQYDSTNNPVDNYAHIWTDSIIMDTVNWIKVSGSFIADSTYTRLVIGNFFDDDHTDTLTSYSPVPSTAFSPSYYYIDDICVSTDPVVCDVGVSYITMPNVFTPNGDYLNDVFKPIKKENISSAEMSIYNRWGNKVFETKNIDSGWTGEECSEGVYYWIIKYENSQGEMKDQRGYVTLLK